MYKRQQTDKPDYTLLSNHTGSRRETEALLEKLGRAEGLSRVDFWQREDHIFLWYDGMERSPVPVSYTHLDVYKRQAQYIPQNETPNGDIDTLPGQERKDLPLGLSLIHI